MFKERFIKLCNERKIAPSKVCREIGITPATYSGWTTDTIPRDTTLQRIATFFEVMPEYLTGESQYRTLDEAEQAYEYLCNKAVEYFDESFTDLGYTFEASSHNENQWWISNGEQGYYLTLDELVNEYKTIKNDAESIAFRQYVSTLFSATELTTDCTEQEKTLIRVFRETTEDGRLEMIAAIINIRNAIEKKNTSANTSSAG